MSSPTRFLLPLVLLSVVLVACSALVRSPSRSLPTPTPQPSISPTSVITVTPAVVVEVRQPATPPQSFWDRYGVVAVVIGAIIGGVAALVFNNLLGPTVTGWGEALKDWLKGEAGRFREKYVPAVAEEHRYLKLVGIHGKEGLPPPPLKEVYVSLRMGGTGEADPLAPPLSIAEALANHRYLLILGEPGAGKSTLLDYLTLVYTGEVEVSALKNLGSLLPPGQQRHSFFGLSCLPRPSSPEAGQRAPLFSSPAVAGGLLPGG